MVDLTNADSDAFIRGLFKATIRRTPDDPAPSKKKMSVSASDKLIKGLGEGVLSETLKTCFGTQFRSDVVIGGFKTIIDGNIVGGLKQVILDINEIISEVGTC